MAQLSLRYKHYALGKLPAGAVVEVALSCINNVRLMDEVNYQLFKNSKQYRYFGDLIQKTPAKLSVPKTGIWHVVVDREGLPTLANSNIRTIIPSNIRALGMHAQNFKNIAPTLAAALDSDAIALGSEGQAEIEDIRKELDQYKKMALTDALTKLNNRRAFDEKLASIFASGTKLEETALVISDIDHFKKFNDTYGHFVGDKVLVTVAKVLKTNIRKDMFLARTGGEEFAIIIEGESQIDAFRIADRARRALQSTPFINPQTKTECGPLTISMGLCMASDAADPLQLYQKSDYALYASKKAGRNRCTIFDQNTFTDPQKLTNSAVA